MVNDMEALLYRSSQLPLVLASVSTWQSPDTGARLPTMVLANKCNTELTEHS